VTVDHLVALGFAVLQIRWLKQLREQFGISRRQLAEVVGVSTQTLRRWEEGDLANVWRNSALRLGTFYFQAIPELEKVHQLDEDFNEYRPASVVASFLAQPTFVVEKMCEAGELNCLNLGILGVYVKYRNPR
jgi:transcriptional regulator with XRE-family HTH domain